MCVASSTASPPPTSLHADEIEAQIKSLAAKQAQSDASFLADALDRRAKAQTQMTQFDVDMRKARQRLGERRLLTPVAGTVQAVKIHTPGAVVTSADVLMTIVPDGAGIEIEAGVDNKDIGFVREGQEVAIKVDAFPFTRYGLLHGTLRKVGRDAVSSGAAHDVASGPGASSAAPTDAGLTYPAKVTLGQYWIAVDGKREPIQSGMRVSAEIKTGDRRAIEYLLSPVVQAVQEAGRER